MRISDWSSDVCSSDLRSHADLVARISAASGATGLVIDYRLAPEHRFPAPIDDVLAVCAALEARGDFGTISFVGDSAGGNLALASILALRERGSPLPAAIDRKSTRLNSSH